jgi:hypothetical protein
VTDFLDEQVFDMPAMSMAKIERLGEVLLKTLAPETLRQPMPLDLVRMIDKVLPQYDIHVYPAEQAELGSREAATDPEGKSEIIILVEEEAWKNLYRGGARANRARATVSHEISHAILHVPVIRKRLKSERKDFLLARVKRSDLPPYRDPEWQAWALAGCLLMPRLTIEMLDDQSPFNIAEVYAVSSDFARSHCKRLRLHI